ncbi:MAG: Thioredoxin domain protein 2 [Candidatus Gottesmanbacteria bacterium GW2011_GWA1_34_13]|uniref:Thioredoxin domain protein 2 n=1 Tax=Candidatus Gottesmanbacteria bacterium GW2011_GWA1_34_13 TaxID=1618434 RepID=A0A0G0ASJ0_9BACT|nr:MAG: Thioredoxin domain protein 2 [Candidatus Gottesmanbacteria bacterium GW2011_GWA1_34_13]
MKKYLTYTSIVLVILGVVDAGYLTWEHYAQVIPPCYIGGWFSDCGKVLTSQYAVILGVPLSLIGLVFYTVEATLMFLAVNKNRLARMGLIITSIGGFIASLVFIFLMYKLQAICLYCLGSAIISFLLFTFINYIYRQDRIRLATIIFSQIYTNFAKPIFFRIDPEKIHVTMVYFGEIIGKFKLAQIFLYQSSGLSCRF